MPELGLLHNGLFAIFTQNWAYSYMLEKIAEQEHLIAKHFFFYFFFFHIHGLVCSHKQKMNQSVVRKYDKSQLFTPALHNLLFTPCSLSVSHTSPELDTHSTPPTDLNFLPH